MMHHSSPTQAQREQMVPMIARMRLNGLSALAAKRLAWYWLNALIRTTFDEWDAQPWDRERVDKHNEYWGSNATAARGYDWD